MAVDIRARLITSPTHHSRPSLLGWAVLRPLIIVATARLMMLVVLRLGTSLKNQSVFTYGWDSGWYVLAAQHGWPKSVPMTGGHAAASTLAFFPAFPELIRVMHFLLPLSWPRAGTAAVLLTEATMAIAFWVLTRDIFDERTADRATVLLCFFPGALVFALIYSEPLLITLAAICIYALRKQRWEVAGVAAAVATATRPNAVALVACCAWEAYRAIRSRRQWRPLVAPLLAPVGVVAWFVYLWASTGSKLAWFHAEQGGWGERIQALALVHLLADDLHHPFLFPNQYVTLTGTAIVGCLLVVFALRWRRGVPSVLIVYTAAILGLSLMSKTLGLRPRFIMTAFPLFMILGYRLKDTAHTLVTAAFAMTMAILLVVTVSTLALTP